MIQVIFELSFIEHQLRILKYSYGISDLFQLILDPTLDIVVKLISDYLHPYTKIN